MRFRPVTREPCTAIWLTSLLGPCYDSTVLSLHEQHQNSRGWDPAVCLAGSELLHGEAMALVWELPVRFWPVTREPCTAIWLTSLLGSGCNSALLSLSM